MEYQQRYYKVMNVLWIVVSYKTSIIHFCSTPRASKIEATGLKYFARLSYEARAIEPASVVTEGDWAEEKFRALFHLFQLQFVDCVV